MKNIKDKCDSAQMLYIKSFWYSQEAMKKKIKNTKRSLNVVFFIVRNYWYDLMAYINPIRTGGDSNSAHPPVFFSIGAPWEL